jgi:predicted nucleic acid-binding protein
MLVAFDTNVLIYAGHFNDPERARQANAIRSALPPERSVIPAQVLGEFFHALVGKFRIGRREAERACDWLRLSAQIRAASEADFASALALAATNGLQIWDALILVTAAEAGCALLLSEDMQDGFVHRGVTVANPFAARLHPLLADALRHG